MTEKKQQRFKLDIGFLKKRRKFLGLKQHELAKRAGCSQVTIHAIETERRTPSINLFLDIIEALECSPGFYFTRVKNA